MDSVLAEVLARCQVACEAESVSRGFTPELGREIYQGCIADDLEGWDDDQSFIWYEGMLGRHSIDPDVFIPLYHAICEIMGSYAPMLKGADYEPNN